jgi:hypothetical protein
MQNRPSRSSPRLTRKDAGVVVAVGLVVVVLSGMCWHFASESRVRFRNYDGVVVAKVSRLPPGKQMYPVRRDIVIEQSDGTRETIAVSEPVYQRARPGMKFHRDRFGNATVESFNSR